MKHLILLLAAASLTACGSMQKFPGIDEIPQYTPLEQIDRRYPVIGHIDSPDDPSRYFQVRESRVCDSGRSWTEVSEFFPEVAWSTRCEEDARPDFIRRAERDNRRSWNAKRAECARNELGKGMGYAEAEQYCKDAIPLR